MTFAIAFAIIATVRIAGLDESSGLVASRRNPGIFWTMNDGSGAYLYAFDRSGAQKARIRIQNAMSYDWEDLALGPGDQLYIGDIGDNNQRRKSITIYRIPEPTLSDERSAPAQAFRFTYPDGRHDAEALLVHPKTGDLYIVAKTRGKSAPVYKATAPFKSGKLNKIGDITLPNESLLQLLVGRITGGAISPDGRRVIVCDYERGWEAIVPKNGNFDAVWTTKWHPVDLGVRAQGEAVTYRHDGRAILATSEGVEFPLIEVNISGPSSVR